MDFQTIILNSVPNRYCKNTNFKQMINSFLKLIIERTLSRDRHTRFRIFKSHNQNRITINNNIPNVLNKRQFIKSCLCLPLTFYYKPSVSWQDSVSEERFSPEQSNHKMDPSFRSSVDDVAYTKVGRSLRNLRKKSLYSSRKRRREGDVILRIKEVRRKSFFLWKVAKKKTNPNEQTAVPPPKNPSQLWLLPVSLSLSTKP